MLKYDKKDFCSAIYFDFCMCFYVIFIVLFIFKASEMYNEMKNKYIHTQKMKLNNLHPKKAFQQFTPTGL